MSKFVQLKKVRLSFPNLVEATTSAKFPTSAPRYRADLILTANDPQFAEAMKEIGNAAVIKWKEHAGSVMNGMDVKLRCWGRGEEKVKSSSFVVYDGYAGMVYLKTSNYEDSPPIVITMDGKQVENGTPLRAIEARKLYGGCYVNAVVEFKAWENNGSRGIRAKLVAVQFDSDGEPFGEADPDVSGMFGAVQQPAAAAPVPGFTPGAMPPGWPNAQPAAAAPKMPWEQ